MIDAGLGAERDAGGRRAVGLEVEADVAARADGRPCRRRATASAACWSVRQGASAVPAPASLPVGATKYALSRRRPSKASMWRRRLIRTRPFSPANTSIRRPLPATTRATRSLDFAEICPGRSGVADGFDRRKAAAWEGCDVCGRPVRPVIGCVVGWHYVEPSTGRDGHSYVRHRVVLAGRVCGAAVRDGGTRLRRRRTGVLNPTAR